MNSSVFCLLVVVVGYAVAQGPALELGPGTTFILYANLTNSYVTVDPDTYTLYANGATIDTAAVFSVGRDGEESWSIIFIGNGDYVTNANAGTQADTATAGAASTWENVYFTYFINGAVVIQALINGNWLTVQSDSTLIATSASGSNYEDLPPLNVSFFAFAPPTYTSSPISSISLNQQVIISNNGYYVYIDTTDIYDNPDTLTVSTTDATKAAIFTITANGDNYALLYTVPFGYVSAIDGGSDALEVNGGNLGGWEEFAFTAVSGTDGAFVITSVANGNLVTVQSDGELIPNSLTVDSSTIFIFSTPAI